MLALAFSFSVFLYWAVLGRAVAAVAYPRLGVLKAWLVAPAVGLSTLLLTLMVFNQAGAPIGRFASPVTLGLGAAAVGILLWRRPTAPAKSLGVYLGAVLTSLLWTGWPALETGFDWVSYANDDMANYCLAAQRFIDRGFYDAPTMAELAGQDYSSYYFFMHVADMMRFGAEHLVAWSASIARVKATQGFMPVIVALGLTQICAAGALVLHRGRMRLLSQATVWILAASPLFMLGTLYQLIAQVGGVALLGVTLSLLTRPWVTERRRVVIRYSLLPAITAAALCIFYPEVTPFVGLGFAAYATLWTVRERRLPRALAGLAAYTLVGVFVLLRHNIISYLSILVVQFNGAMDASNLLLSLFPYFMLPTGFSNFLGWMPIAHDFSDTVVTLSIVAGMVVVALVLLRAVRDAWRLSPAAILLLIQFVFAVRLFSGANDFGLYKLAMWMQPVLAAGLAGWALWLGRRRPVAVAAIAGLYLLSTAATGWYYADASRGTRSGSLTELRMASRYGLDAKIPGQREAEVTSTIENVVAAKFAATELRGHSLALVSRDFFWPTTRTDFYNPIWPVRMHPHYSDMAVAAPLITERNRDLIKTGVLWNTHFTQPVLAKSPAFYVSVDPQLSLYNKFHLAADRPAPNSVFTIEPAAALKNRLLFVHSGLGNHYYLGDRRRIALFQQERDVFAPGHDFNAIGRFMLMRIENPSPKIYLRISATRTIITDQTHWSPRAIVHGASDLPLGAVGNGAFNLFVGPLEPQEFEGAEYIAVDFAEFPRQIKDRRRGLKRLYNEKVPLDYRRILAFARDISALSESEFAELKRPREIARFPEDLALARTLEFSGAYEDGWLSPRSRFILAGAQSGDWVRLRMMTPSISGSALGKGSVVVKINGEQACELATGLGLLDTLIPVSPGTDTTAIELEFTASTLLPNGDRRPVGTKLEYLGLRHGSAPLACDYDRQGEPRIASGGVDTDGWLEQEAWWAIPPSDRPQEGVVTLQLPGWPGIKAATFRVQTGTEPAVEVSLNPGQTQEVRLKLPSSAKMQSLRLFASHTFSIPGSDRGGRAARALAFRLEPAGAE